MQIKVLDQDGEISLSYEDLLKYAGKANVIACALMLRLCEKAFAMLSPDALVLRRELRWQLGFPGPGILDCVEMISHAVRDGRCLQDPAMESFDAPASVIGHFCFKVGYRGQWAVLIPTGEIFDDEFVRQVSRWQEECPDTPGREKYLEYKKSKVREILEMNPDELFRAWLTRG